MITQYVGIDIAHKTATVAWKTALQDKPTVLTIPQTPVGYHHLIAHLHTLGQPHQIHLVMEATSTYWMALAYRLVEAHFIVSVVNPIQPKYFAKMRGQRTKTDAIDAVMLMEFAQICQPAPWTPPPAIWETLRQYLTYRDQLIAFQTQVRNQLHAFQQNPQADPALLQRIKQRLQSLSDEIQQLKTHIHTLLISDHDWAQAADYLLSIPGISTISAAWLLVATQAFARCDTPQQAASFAGLAPHAKDSGDQRGYRSVGGSGHQHLRNVLYMASAAASRFNPLLKPFYDQLVARGKPKKVARCAVARKLIHIAWACVTKQCYFDPAHALSA
jgi:transposase